MGIETKTQPLLVYFAGKITALETKEYWYEVGPNDYRFQLLDKCCMDEDEHGHFHYIGIRGCLAYGGPTAFFGKPHNLYWSGVPQQCFRQIEQCDAVYAYIENPDAYGTLVELGFAVAKQKPIFLQFAASLSDQDKSHWWFIQEAPLVNLEHNENLTEPLIPDELIRSIPRPLYKEWYSTVYLKSEHWEQIRFSALCRADNRCQLCNTGSRLQVHHRTYERIGCEKESDLIVLCRNCHAKFHDKD